MPAREDKRGSDVAPDMHVPMSTGTRPSAPADTARSASLPAHAEVAQFAAAIRALAPRADGQRGRLIFALDATFSRSPTWDMAQSLQADMFAAVREIGGLDVQLVYFRGIGECRASRWVSDPAALIRLMSGIDCRGGHTQIGKILSHARQELTKGKVSALVFVGDCMEEDADDLCARAGELALLGLPVFIFQEGDDARAGPVFREIARLTRGACCRFDRGAAAQLRELLRAVAIYASGGRRALEQLANRSDAGARRLIASLPPS